MSSALLLAALVLCAPLAGAARPAPGRALLTARVGDVPHPETDSHFATSVHVTGAIPRYTVPGTNVAVVDTFNTRDGRADGGVLSNALESSARAGRTDDVLGTIVRTRVTGQLSADNRAALGGMDQQAYVAQAASADSHYEHELANQRAQGVAQVTARGRGKTINDPENRAALASMDTSSAIQMMTSGMTRDPYYGTRIGAASATAVQAPTSYWHTFVPTWWRR